MLGLALGIVIAAACAGIGLAILRHLRADDAGPAESIAFATALGMGVVAYAVLGLGLIGLWRREAFIPLVALALLAAVPALLRSAKRRRRAGPRRAGRGPADAIPILLGLFLAVVGALTLLSALAPSAANDWDGLSYHLAVPKVWLEGGRITFLPWVSHSNFPFTIEMLYGLGLGLLPDGQPLAKFFNWLAGALTVLAIYALGRRCWGKPAGLVGGAIFAGMPLILWEGGTAGNDLAVGLYSTLAFIGVLNWWRGRSQGWLWVAALACGFALGSKLFAVVIWAFLSMAVLLHTAVGQKQPWPRAVALAAKFALLSAVVAAPWYVKSQIMTGNPFYPFFYGWFGGREWGPLAEAAYTVEQARFGIGRGWLDFVRLPWTLTMSPREFWDFPTASLGPLPLALIPAAVLIRRTDAATRFLLAAALVFLVGWFLSVQHIRYLTPILPILAAVAGGAVVSLRQVRRWLAAVAGLAVVVVSIAAVLMLESLAKDQPGRPGCPVLPGFARTAIGLESRDTYLDAWLLDLWDIYRAIDDNLPPGARIIFYGDTRGFYCPRNYLWGGWGAAHHQMIDYLDMDGPEDLARRYRELGVTHVMIRVSKPESDFAADAPKARELIDQAIGTGRLRQVLREGDYRVYEVSEAER